MAAFARRTASASSLVKKTQDHDFKSRGSSTLAKEQKTITPKQKNVFVIPLLSLSQSLPLSKQKTQIKRQLRGKEGGIHYCKCRLEEGKKEVEPMMKKESGRKKMQKASAGCVCSQFVRLVGLVLMLACLLSSLHSRLSLGDPRALQSP